MQKFTFKSNGKDYTVFADKMEREYTSVYFCPKLSYNFYRKKLGFKGKDSYYSVGYFSEIKNLKEEHDVTYKKNMNDLEKEMYYLHEMILTLNEKIKEKPEKKTGWFRRLF